MPFLQLGVEEGEGEAEVEVVQSDLMNSRIDNKEDQWGFEVEIVLNLGQLPGHGHAPVQDQALHPVLLTTVARRGSGK